MLERVCIKCLNADLSFELINVCLFIGCNLNAIKAATIAAIPVAIKKEHAIPMHLQEFLLRYYINNCNDLKPPNKKLLKDFLKQNLLCEEIDL